MQGKHFPMSCTNPWTPTGIHIIHEQCSVYRLHECIENEHTEHDMLADTAPQIDILIQFKRYGYLLSLLSVIFTISPMSLYITPEYIMSYIACAHYDLASFWNKQFWLTWQPMHWKLYNYILWVQKLLVSIWVVVSPFWKMNSYIYCPLQQNLGPTFWRITKSLECSQCWNFAWAKNVTCNVGTCNVERDTTYATKTKPLSLFFHCDDDEIDPLQTSVKQWCYQDQRYILYRMTK